MQRIHSDGCRRLQRLSKGPSSISILRCDNLKSSTHHHETQQKEIHIIRTCLWLELSLTNLHLRDRSTHLLSPREGPFCNAVHEEVTIHTEPQSNQHSPTSRAMKIMLSTARSDLSCQLAKDLVQSEAVRLHMCRKGPTLDG